MSLLDRPDDGDYAAWEAARDYDAARDREEAAAASNERLRILYGNEQDCASSLRRDLDRAEAAISAVRAIHRPGPGGECAACSVSWAVPLPCPTLVAINDAFTVVAPPHVHEWLAGAVDRDTPVGPGETDCTAELVEMRRRIAEGGDLLADARVVAMFAKTYSDGDVWEASCRLLRVLAQQFDSAVAPLTAALEVKVLRAALCDAPSDPPVELERGADAPSSVATFEPGWLPEQIAKSKATLDSLPPDLRASLGKPGPEPRTDQGGTNG